MNTQETALYNLYHACRRWLNDTCQGHLRKELRSSELALAELETRLTQNHITVEQIVALLEQWKKTQEEVIWGRQSRLLSRSEHDYHRGLRDGYAAVLSKLKDEPQWEDYP